MRFRALTDLYLNTGVYVQAGTVFDAPSEYPPPTNAVDPLDAAAVQAYHDVGPRGCSDAEWRRAIFTNGQRWSDIPVPPPATQWLPIDPTKPGLGFTLGSGDVFPPI
jgi:hypothetical protein